jgi:DNA-binding IclR family transcriptional regulator
VLTVARPAPGVDRVVAVLTLLADNPGDQLSLSDICRRLDLNVATAHSMLGALTAANFLARHPSSKRYSLGPALVRVGIAAAANQHAVVDRARTEMIALAENLGRQCVASTVVGDEILLLAKVGPTGPMGLTVQVGERLPYIPPFGTVFAAWSDQEQVLRWLRHIDAVATEATIQYCIDALATVRARGYAIGVIIDRIQRQQVISAAQRSGQSRVEVSGQLSAIVAQDYLPAVIDASATYHVSMLAAPVFSSTSDVVLALSLPFMAEELSAAQISDYAAALCDAAARTTAAIDGRRPSTI